MSIFWILLCIHLFGGLLLYISARINFRYNWTLEDRCRAIVFGLIPILNFLMAMFFITDLIEELVTYISENTDWNKEVKW